MLADCYFLRAALPRLALLYDLTCSYYPLLRSRWRLCRLTDAVHPLRVPLCPSCRSTAQFPSTASPYNAASEAMPLFRTQSAAKQTSLAPHDSKARLRVVANRRRFMAKPCTPHPIPQAAQLFELQTANVRGQGGSPLAFLWGFQRGCSLWKENTPFAPATRRRHSPPRCARKNCHACKATTLYTHWCKTI